VTLFDFDTLKEMVGKSVLWKEKNGVVRACKYRGRPLARAHPLVADVGKRFACPSRDRR
jgi:hypothetical protein